MQKQTTSTKEYSPRPRTAAWIVIKLLAERSPRTSGDLASASGKSARMIQALLNRLFHYHALVYQGKKGSGYVLTKKGKRVARALGFVGTTQSAVAVVHEYAPARVKRVVAAHDARPVRAAPQAALRVTPSSGAGAGYAEGLFADYYPKLAAERAQLAERIAAIDAFARAWLGLRHSDGKENGASRTGSKKLGEIRDA